jgi:hypothetical protein
MKTAVVSIPKTGTYLVGEILKCLGLSFRGHVSTHDYMQSLDLETLRSDPDKALVPIDFDRFLESVWDNEFVVGHFPCDGRVRNKLHGWKTVFTHRELRDVVVSCTRYYSKIVGLRSPHVEKAKLFKSLPLGEEKISLWFELWGREYSNLAHAMKDWPAYAHAVRFENVAGLRGRDKQIETIIALCNYLEVPFVDSELAMLIDKCLATETVTSTGKLSNYTEVWTPALEDLFVAYRFNEVILE